MQNSTQPARYRLLVHTAMVALAYFAGAKMGLAYAVVGGAVSLVWPSSGIALAALLVLGIEVAPGIALGSIAANVSVGVPPPVALVIALGAMTASLLAWLALKRFVRFRSTMDRSKDVIAFIILGATASTAVSALTGASALVAAGLARPAEYITALLQWWLGDMMGVLVVTPVLLTTISYTHPVHSARLALEACVLALATAWISYLIFGSSELAGHGYYPAALAIFPFTIWAALRFDHWGTCLSTLLVAIIAIWGTTNGTGPFAGETPVDSLVRWCAFANVVAASGLLLVAAHAQEKRIQWLLLASHVMLEARVQERTLDLERANQELRAEIARRRLLEAELIRNGDQQQRLIGQELHDGLGQHLTSLSFYCMALNEDLHKHRHPAAASAAKIVELVRQAASMTRKVAHGLDPVAIEAGGLSAALQGLVMTTRSVNGIDCALQIRSEVDFLAPPLQIHLYRAAQEAVNNALKYSHGRHIWIELDRTGGLQRLSISDDGVGVAEDQMARGTGLGLHNLRHRASLLGGSCTVSSNNWGGTTVAISFPIPESPDHARNTM
ncbi:MASE1 domain-containing protein [Cupriavidus sp. D384]|uniref:MASE1 domain-containing protein n=1 Tax=Cupriavidus sp. D384 TaxID=1538095 RepID=UPI00082F2AA3|nr:MASE1 domain-containing protein [Cupriavidus sp. D384]